MNNTKPDTTASADMQIEFARLLGDQLDNVDFPASPMRAATLSTTCNVAKTQAYKLLKGMAFPSLANFVTLRKLGVSMDEMLDLLIGADKDLTELHIGNHAVHTTIKYLKAGSTSQVVALPRADSNGVDLCVVMPGMKVPAGAKPIGAITFPKQISLAIIEDNKAELQELGESMSRDFRPVMFSTAKSFFKQPIANYDLILLDWNLPDMTGTAIVERIRSQTNAPIFIVTGDDGATDAIISVMNDKTIHHVSKPTNIKILIKRLIDAVSQPS